MKKLHRFMLKSYIGPFIATFFISMFVLVMQFLWQYIDDLVGKGLEGSVIAHLLFYVSMGLVPMGLPLAVLLASIMTFGSMGENYELIALKSAGISLYRIMQPLIVLTIIFTIGAFYFSNNILPYANLKAKSLLYDIRRHKPELSIKPGVFSNDIDNYSILVDHIDTKTGMMYNLLIYNHSGGNRNIEVVIADSGIMEASPAMDFMEVELYSGYQYTDEGVKSGSKSYPFRKVQFEKQYFGIPMSGNELERTDEEQFKGRYDMLNLEQLNYTIDSIGTKLSGEKAMKAATLRKNNYVRGANYNEKADSIMRIEVADKWMSIDSLYLTFDPKEQMQVASNALRYARDVQQSQVNYNLTIAREEEMLRQYNIEWHKKFTLSFACFIFFFIGAPLGGIIRKGGLGMPVIVSILLFIIYYIINMMGIRTAREGVISPILGTWISSLILLPFGVFLTYTSMTDSSILSSEAYGNFVKSIISFFKKKKDE